MIKSQIIIGSASIDFNFRLMNPDHCLNFFNDGGVKEFGLPAANTMGQGRMNRPNRR